MTALQTLCRRLLPVVILAAAATPAVAQITATPVPMAKNPFGRNSAAFDSQNGVYLVIDSGTPISGRFLNKSGTLVGSPFGISSGGEGFTGWPVVTSGGPADDPVFLVTYVIAVG